MIPTPYLNDSLPCEVTIGPKMCIIETVYIPPTQNSEEFKSFLSQFKFLLQYISSCNLIQHYYLVITMQADMRRSGGIRDITTTEGTQLETTATIYGQQRLTNESTHILKNSSSCIDLTFTNQPNLIAISGIHPSFRNLPPTLRVTLQRVTLKQLLLFILVEKVM